MNILEYFNKNSNEIHDKIKKCDDMSLFMLNNAYLKKDSLYKAIPKGLTSNKYMTDDIGKITDRDGSIIYSMANPILNGFESANAISSDITINSKCHIRGDVNCDAKNIIDKSMKSFNSYVYSDYIYSHKTLDDIENTKSDISGVFYEIVIDMPVSRRINYITIDATSKFFQNAIYIKYSPTDMDYHRKNLVTLNYEKITNNTYFFNEVSCKKIYIGVVQSHYELVTKDGYPKFLYKLNINNITSGYKLYTAKSFYQSQYMSYRSSTISLTANIQEDDDASSEFYISFDKKKYQPILPINIKICKERLFFTNGIAILRFKALNIISVKKDLEYIDYTVKEDNGIYAICLDSAPGSIYVVRYTPVSDSYILKGTSNITVENEIIHCSYSNSYKLSKTPISDDVSIEISDNLKSKIYKGDKIINTTNNSNVWNSGKFSYSLSGDIITFDKELDDRYSINITYKIQKEGLSIRAIMRQNTKKSLNNKTIVKDIQIL